MHISPENFVDGKVAHKQTVMASGLLEMARVLSVDMVLYLFRAYFRYFFAPCLEVCYSKGASSAGKIVYNHFLK